MIKVNEFAIRVIKVCDEQRDVGGAYVGHKLSYVFDDIAHEVIKNELKELGIVDPSSVALYTEQTLQIGKANLAIMDDPRHVEGRINTESYSPAMDSGALFCLDLIEVLTAFVKKNGNRRVYCGAGFAPASLPKAGTHPEQNDHIVCHI